METGQPNSDWIDFPLVNSGFVNTLSHYYGQSRPSLIVRLQRVLLLIAVTWLPLLVLTLASGHAFSGNVNVPLLYDPALTGRFLFVLPVLEFAEAIVAISLPVQVRHFAVAEIVPHHQRSRFEADLKDVLKLRSSAGIEWFIAILSFVLAIVFRFFLFVDVSSSWEYNGTTTLAGWYYALVSLPILYFFLFRWLWIFLLWGWFLFLVSRLDLQLTPTHPDHAGGLGFLGWGLASFSSVVMAISAMFSSAVYYEILHKNESIDTLKYHIILFVVVALLILHAPLLVFFGRLSRCRFRGLLEFSSLVLRYDRAFDEKWIEKRFGEPSDPLLGSADVQALADVATCYDHVNDMLLLPFDVKGFFVLAAAALLPMVPLIGTALPMNEIVAKLAELMV